METPVGLEETLKPNMKRETTTASNAAERSKCLEVAFVVEGEFEETVTAVDVELVANA